MIIKTRLTACRYSNKYKHLRVINIHIAPFYKFIISAPYVKYGQMKNRQNLGSHSAKSSQLFLNDILNSIVYSNNSKGRIFKFRPSVKQGSVAQSVERRPEEAGVTCSNQVGANLIWCK